LRPVVLWWSSIFTGTATSEIYTLSLHDALPISLTVTGLLTTDVILAVSQSVPGANDLPLLGFAMGGNADELDATWSADPGAGARSEEHTSELQSRENLVCRLLLEKKKDERTIAA